MKSVALVISDAAITRHAADVTAGELRDHKSPLVLRFHKARDKATWYLVRYERGSKKMHRVGYWPALKTKDAQAMVPDMLKNLVIGAEVQNSQFVTVGQLLQWYKKRVEQETLKSRSRRNGVINVIDKHLLRRLGAVRITAVTKAVIDEKLMLPLQSDGLKPGTIRNYFGVLKRAFSTAYELDLISIDPLVGMKFVDYIQRRIMPRESKLLTSDRKQVLDAVLGYEPAALVLQLLMLMFALRIGEARQLARSMVRFDRGLLAIPASITKTGHDNNLPLTTWATAVLSAVIGSTECDHLITVRRQPLTKDQAQKLFRATAAGKYRSHDLRKLARSTWAEMGMDYWVSERLLNHRQKGQDQAYIKADAYEVKLAALQQYHDLLFAGFDTGSMQVLINSRLRCSASKNAA